MKILIRGIITLTLLAALFLLFIFSGIYNIGATSPHYKFTRWVISKMTDHSIKHYAGEVTEPPNLTDSSLIKTGFIHYREMCSGCHGAPGINRNEVAEGLYPKPPRLLKSANEWKPAELFWIIKNGIKMTGMPGFGISHSDDKIWAMVAFMEKLPDMTPDHYKTLNNTIKKDE
jgi:mono/diheme cytochrome c family protein